MKYLSIIVFLFITCLSNAQTVTSDTLYFKEVNGVLYQITRTEYDNGSYSESRTATTKQDVSNQYSLAIENDAAKYAEAVRMYFNTKRFYRQALRFNNSLETSLSVSPFDTLQAKYQPVFLNTASETTWKLFTLDVDGKTTKETDVTFGVHPTTGKLRVRIGADAFRPLDVMGQMFVLRNFPETGTNTPFFFVRGTTWEDITETYEFRVVRLNRR